MSESEEKASCNYTFFVLYVILHSEQQHMFNLLLQSFRSLSLDLYQ